MIDRVRDACAQGRQAYWVCTLIDESEALQCRAAEDTAEALAAALPGLRVGLVHGRLKATKREPVMADFAAGALDLLGDDRDRGRDGRPERQPDDYRESRASRSRPAPPAAGPGRTRIGPQPSCPPLFSQAQARLAILRESSDGFEIARRDLQLRGSGEILETRQTGGVQFRITDPAGDEKLLPAVRQTADLILERHPGHVRPSSNAGLGNGWNMEACSNPGLFGAVRGTGRVGLRRVQP